MNRKRKRKPFPRFKCQFKFIKDYKWYSHHTYSDSIVHMQRTKFPDAVWRNLKMYADLYFDEAQTMDNIFFWGSCVTRCNHRIHWEITDRGKQGKEAARILGQMGGKSGVGKKKVRGDSNYYKMLAQKSVNARLKKKLAKIEIDNNLKNQDNKSNN